MDTIKMVKDVQKAYQLIADASTIVYEVKAGIGSARQTTELEALFEGFQAKVVELLEDIPAIQKSILSLPNAPVKYDLGTFECRFKVRMRTMSQIAIAGGESPDYVIDTGLASFDGEGLLTLFIDEREPYNRWSYESFYSEGDTPEQAIARALGQNYRVDWVEITS